MAPSAEYKSSTNPFDGPSWPYNPTVRIAATPRWAVFPATVALFAIGLKVIQWHFARPLWLDEEMLLLNVRDRGFLDLPGPLWLNQTAPLGWLALEHAVIAVFGTPERAVRALPVSFGIATVAAAAWFAIRRMGPAGATLFVAVCASGLWMNYYAFEAKPYSADAFWALLLPVTAIWALEPGTASPTFVRRALFWWSAAAIGQWFSYGAVFVTPGCAVVLCVVAWARGRSRLAAIVASGGIIWLLCFAAHYQLTIRYANHSDYLRQYWWWGFPPQSPGFVGALRWLALQLEPLASHPAGTAHWPELWLLAIYAFVISIRTRLTFGLIIFLVPLSAFALALLRVAPLGDRLALWIVPSLYISACVAVDDAIDRLRRAVVRRDWKLAIVGIVVGVMSARVCVDILERGYKNLTIVDRFNHGHDDRSGLTILTAQRQSGDVFLTTHAGLSAVWWYAPISVADPNAGRTNPADGTPILEVSFKPGPAECRTSGQKNEIGSALVGTRRVLVYLGFASQSPPGFQELLLDKLSELGRMTSYRRVGDGVAAIFDLTRPPETWTGMLPTPTGPQTTPVLRPRGCIGIGQTAGR